MKLTLKELQVLDFLLQLNYSNKVSIVIDIKDKFWYGNFVKCPSKSIYKYSIDESDNITDRKFNLTELFGSDPKPPNVSAIDNNYLPLVLEHLIDFIKKSNLPNINLQPILYNATRLDDNFKLPFLYLNPFDTYDVVSLITSTKY